MVLKLLCYAGAGALGGFVRLLVTGKGLIPLPKVVEQEGGKFLNLGFIAPIVIGLFAGILSPYALGGDGVVAGIGGYCLSDAIENLIERLYKLPKKD